MGGSIGNGDAQCLRPKLGDDADNRRYILTGPRNGYRIEEGWKATEGVAATDSILFSWQSGLVEARIVIRVALRVRP